MESELLKLGRQAFAERVWPDAYEHLTAADLASPLPPDDLERLATVAYLTGRDHESTEAWTRAHRQRLDRGEHREAVRCAFWLGFGLVQRGEMAQGGAWLARAGTVAEQHDLDCVERGYLRLPEGLMTMGAGDAHVALVIFEEVDALARRFGDPDLVALGSIGRGEALLRLGRARDGLRLLDDAMVSVTADETSPTVAGIVYCAVIDFCQQVLDLRRAREWTGALDRWCDGQPGLVPYRGQCLVHRSQVRQMRGDWDAALAEAQHARARLSDPPHPAIGMAHCQLGDLHRLRGEFADAEGAYLEAHACGRDPQPGLALLRLAEGRPAVAATAIESALDEAGDPLARVRLLPAYAEIMLATGRLEDAAAAADELEAAATDDDGALHHAVAARTRGAILLATSEPASALPPLRAALQVWHELDAPYEVACTRLLLAAGCRALGDDDRAQLECDAARRVLEELGADPALRLLEDVIGEPSDALPVTTRELEVLRLVADGRTNREIAVSMAISEKTVERHLSNIFTKLGVANRAGATAYAYEHGWL